MPPDKAKPALKGKDKTTTEPKTSAADAQAAIAQAMQQAESPNSFAEGQTVKLKTDVKGPAGGVISCKDHTATIVRAIASLAGSLGLEMVGEGVENHAQLALLQELGCHQIQGFLFSRPLPASELATRFLN